jgi:hypothetical protein
MSCLIFNLLIDSFEFIFSWECLDFPEIGGWCNVQPLRPKWHPHQACAKLEVHQQEFLLRSSLAGFRAVIGHGTSVSGIGLRG